MQKIVPCEADLHARPGEFGIDGRGKSWYSARNEPETSSPRSWMSSDKTHTNQQIEVQVIWTNLSQNCKKKREYY